MIIVAIARGHNASTTLLVDGKVVFYVEEERLTKMKHDGSPLMGLMKVFDYVDHIDHLVICHTHRHGPNLDWTGEDLYSGFVRKLARKKFEFEVHQIDLIHHKMHAACGFYNSGFESAACVIADGAGSFLSQPSITNDVLYEFETIYKAQLPTQFDQVYKHLGTKDSIGILREDTDQNPNLFITEYPGHTKLYEAVTEYCGFPSIEAGKTMGLAPYGKPNPELPQLIRDGWVNRDVIIPTYPNGARVNAERYPVLAEDVLDHRRGEYTQIQKDMAYAVQEATENRMKDLIRMAVDLTGEKNIVVCGGYGLNCVANWKYWKEFPDLNIYCEPISHDGGTSMGGAKFVYSLLMTENGEDIGDLSQSDVYYGPHYEPSTYADALGGLETSETNAKEVAQLIRDGNIVTIFQGRSEGGPRALGNRSILFDPTIPDGKDIVNVVKRREFFRPFAGSMLAEEAHEWFDLAGRDETPHMMYACECLPGVEEKIPSIIHEDGTCRIQTVTKEQNPAYYELISEFNELSGVPILFNTSFNLGGDALVETIEDAVETLQKSDIEYMYLPEIGKLVKVPNE